MAPSVEHFNVCQFFPNGEHEYTRRRVEIGEAMAAFIHYCTSVGARMGTTTRVIMTDAYDSTCLEWEWEKGIVFPVELAGKHIKGARE